MNCDKSRYHGDSFEQAIKTIRVLLLANLSYFSIVCLPHSYSMSTCNYNLRKYIVILEKTGFAETVCFPYNKWQNQNIKTKQSKAKTVVVEFRWNPQGSHLQHACFLFSSSSQRSRGGGRLQAVGQEVVARAHLGFVPCHRITESQDSWGWKGPLEVIWSNPFAQAWPPTAGCPGLRPDSFWVSPRMETPQPLWAACASAQSPSQ